jgi:hypothetical protein
MGAAGGREPFPPPPPTNTHPTNPHIVHARTNCSVGMWNPLSHMETHTHMHALTQAHTCRDTPTNIHI